MLAPIEALDSLGLEGHTEASRSTSPTDTLDHVGDFGATSPEEARIHLELLVEIHGYQSTSIRVGRQVELP